MSYYLTPQNFIMYNAVTGKAKKADIKSIIDQMWTTFGFDIDFEYILEMWDSILNGNGVNPSELEGWSQDERLPYFQSRPQSFDYECELHFLDDSVDYTFSESLNDMTPESEWKAKVANYFTFNNISQI